MSVRACLYCNTPTELQCFDCKGSFCNARGVSTAAHLVFHLAQHHHKQILYCGQPVVCFACGDGVLFNLGVCGFDKIGDCSKSALEPANSGFSNDETHPVGFLQNSDDKFTKNNQKSLNNNSEVENHSPKVMSGISKNVRSCADRISSSSETLYNDADGINVNSASPKESKNCMNKSDHSRCPKNNTGCIDNGDSESIKFEDDSFDHENPSLHNLNLKFREAIDDLKNRRRVKFLESKDKSKNQHVSYSSQSKVTNNDDSITFRNSDSLFSREKNLKQSLQHGAEIPNDASDFFENNQTSNSEMKQKSSGNKRDARFVCRSCSDSSVFTPLVVERCLNPKVFEESTSSTLSQADLARLEARAAPMNVKTKLSYSLQEYVSTYSTLVEAECAAERAFKESLGLDAVFVTFSEEQNSNDAEARAAAYLAIFGFKAIAPPVKSLKKLFCSLCVPNVDSRVSVGDELLLISPVCEVRAYIVLNSTKDDVIRARVFKVVGDFPENGEYALRYVYKDVGRARMLSALRSLKKMCPEMRSLILGAPKQILSESHNDIQIIHSFDRSATSRRSEIDSILNNIDRRHPISGTNNNDTEREDILKDIRERPLNLLSNYISIHKESAAPSTTFGEGTVGGAFSNRRGIRGVCAAPSTTFGEGTTGGAFSNRTGTASYFQKSHGDFLHDTSKISQHAVFPNDAPTFESAQLLMDAPGGSVEVRDHASAFAPLGSNDPNMRSNILSYDTSDIITPPSLPPLNTSQRGAVAAALRQPLTLIQGPPGTGKTVTSVAAVYNLCKKNHRVLVCSSANAAVDNLALKLHETGLRVVRIVSKRREGLADELSFLSLHVQAKILVDEGKKPKDSKNNHEDFKQKEHPKSTDNTQASDVTSSSSTERSTYKNDSITPAKTKRKSKDGSIKPKEQTDLDQNSEEREHASAMRRILAHAQVVTCTCITAGSWVLRKSDFPIVLIDEAVQCTEPLTAIPLAYNCKKLILVGDHKQLGPIILDKRAAKAGLKQSLFERLIRLGNLPYLLNTQYRMHPRLAEWPSNTFYDGSLRSGISAARRLTQVPLPLPTFFLACYGLEEISKSGTSYLNQAETAAVEATVKLLLRHHIKTKQIGIITPYEGQRANITQRLQAQLDITELEIKNVDAFQGREKDFIILSLVRANQSQGIGFLSDKRRLNVALTRAKFGCIIIGNPATLSKDKTWNDLIRFYQDRDMVYKGPIEALENTSVIKKSTAIDLRALFDQINL